MKKKIDKIDTQKLIQSQKLEPEELVYENGKDKMIILVNKQITLSERVKMIEEIFNLVFDKEALTDETNPKGLELYHPELINFAQRSAVIAYFTNIELPKDIEQLSELVMNTHLCEDVINIVGRPVIDGIMYEAQEKIGAYKQGIINNKNFNSVLNKINMVIDGVMEKFKDINLDELKSIISKLKDVDTSNIIQTILNNK